jgi:hypothetical protein
MNNSLLKQTLYIYMFLYVHENFFAHYYIYSFFSKNNAN